MTPPSSGGFRRTTVRGYPTGEVVSALQKCIRRGLEEDACYWALELHESGLGGWAWKRLRIICSEDVGLAWPEGPAVIRALYDNFVDATKKRGAKGTGERLFLIHAVMLLAQAPKSRRVDSAVLYLVRDDSRRDIPDVALDRHTQKGRRMGRGFDHFFEEGTWLANASSNVDDPYLERAREAIERHPEPIDRSGRQASMFDDDEEG